jgi:tRNA threonylcarbamoyl adenosine modification protein YeaZ
VSAAYGLAIHTSSPELGLAIADVSGGPIRGQQWGLGREVSSLLHQTLAEFMPPQTWADLAFVAVSQGPGSFTGTRLGVVLARTLAQQLDIPLFGISSLAAMAATAPATAGSVAVQMPAQRGEIYGAIYGALGSSTHWAAPQRIDGIWSPEQWQQQLDQADRPLSIIAPVDQGAFATQVLALAQQRWAIQARPHWSETLPYYGQHPIAVPAVAPVVAPIVTKA